MYGVCEAWRGVLPSPAPAAYCGQVKRRHQLGANTAIHAQRCVVLGLLVLLFRNITKKKYSDYQIKHLVKTEKEVNKQKDHIHYAVISKNVFGGIL